MASSRAGRLDARILVWAAALFALGAWLGRLDLLDPDEARHAEIAREMLSGGHWLTPELHGEPYYDKPAAFYWLLTISLATFGLDALGARFVPAVAALVTIGATAWFARRAYSEATSTVVVGLLATTVGFVVIGRTVIVDMPFTAALTLAFAWLGVWYVDGKGNGNEPRRSILPFYAFVGAAVLFKGPAAAALAALVAVALVAVERDRSLLARLRPVTGAAVVVAVAAPWYFAAWLVDSSYIETFLLHHNVERYLRPVAISHVEPWYYYPVATAVGLLPWTPVVVAAVVARARTRDGARARADIYCLLWAGAVLAFFLPARTRLATYVLPSFPALLCLAAAHARQRWCEGATPRALGAYSLAWTGSLAAAGATAGLWALAEHRALLGPRIAFALVPLVAFAGAAYAWRTSAAPRKHLVAIGLGSLSLVVVAYAMAADVVNSAKASRASAAALERSGADPISSYRCVPHALAFYAGRTVTRTTDKTEAAAAVTPGSRAALLTKRKWLGELGLDPLPEGVIAIWQNAAGLVLLSRVGEGGDVAEKGGSRTLRRP